MHDCNVTCINHIFQGLIESGTSLYFSGVVENPVDPSARMAVDRIGPLTKWNKKPGKWDSPEMYIFTEVGVKILCLILPAPPFKKMPFIFSWRVRRSSTSLTPTPT